MAKIQKRKLTATEEFEIMKLVIDKFLWLGFAIMAFGLYKVLSDALNTGLYYLLAGAGILIIFLVIIVKEFEARRY